MSIAERIEQYIQSGGDPVARVNLAYYEANASNLYWCKECGAPEVARYSPSVAQRMRSKELCFTCDFWEQRVQGGHQ